MRRAVRLVAGTMAGAVTLLLLQQATAVNLPGPGRGGEAWVRLSWSARPERVETCRRLTDAELADRPAHMRLRLECTGRFARYRLAVLSDGVPLALDTVRGGGLRNDRPMHVLRELAVEPGHRRVRVELVRLDSTETPRDEDGEEEDGEEEDDDSTHDAGVLGARERREAEERSRTTRAAIAPSLVLDTVVALDRGRVLLVTYDGDARRLVTQADATR